MQIVDTKKLHKQLRRLRRWYPHEAADLAKTIVLKSDTGANVGEGLVCLDLDSAKELIIRAVNSDPDLVDAMHDAQIAVATYLGITTIELLARDATSVSKLAGVEQENVND
jgi:hypothetical protein